MRYVSLIGCLLALVSSVQALVIIDSILATQCIYTMKDYDWGCNSTGQGAKAYSCRCHNVDWVGSVTNCLESKGVNNSREFIDHAYRHLRGRCISKGHIDWPVDVLKWYQQNATNYIKEPLSTDLTTTLHHPITVNETKYAYYEKSFNHIYAQVVRSQAYQWGYVFFWTFVIVCGTILNFSRHFVFNYTGLSKSKHTSSFFKTIRSRFTLPNLLSKSYYRIFSIIPIHIPTTQESIVLAFFAIYTVLACCTGYKIELPNAYMNGHIWQLLDLIGYRTALGAFALIPPTFFFGIRNNPFIRLTGSSIQTFMVYHKWSAWAMCINALIHSAVWTDYTIREGDYKAWAMDAYWQWGIAGTTVCFLMLFFAGAWFRELTYELFLIIHQLFGIFLIVTMWFHCNIMGWMGWIYATIVIWCYDRVVRFLSVLANGGAKTAKITRLNEDLLRVVVDKPVNSTYFPGSFYYFYFLNMNMRFYQSHPFSVMKSKRAGEEDCYAVVVKCHKGITRKIMNQLERLRNRNSTFVDVCTEGPYGAPITLRNHEQYVFICAGVGFTPCYAQAVDLVEKSAKTGRAKVIKFLWVVRDTEYYNLFKEDFEYLADNGVEVTVITTRESGDQTTDDHLKNNTSDEEVENTNCCCKESMTLMKRHGGISPQMLGHRPSPSQLVKDTELTGSTCFITSGPVSFVDEVRAAVCEVVKDANVRVDLYDESFSM